MELLQLTATEERIEYQHAKNYERTDLKFVEVSLADLVLMRNQPLDGVLGELARGLPDGSYVAGGAVVRWLVGQPPLMLGSDIDVFFRSMEDKIAATHWIAQRSTEPPYIIGFTESAPLGVLQYRWGPATVQFIETWEFKGGIEELLDSFDFTVCQAGIDVGARKVYFNPMTPVDFAHKRIVVHRDEPHGIKKRLEKYALKGFHLATELTPGEGK